MFKPTKPQHVVNKKYADENSGGGGSAQGIVVEFDHYENPDNVHDQRLISKTKIASAVESFKSGGVVTFRIPEVSGMGFLEGYARACAYFPNETYYKDGEEKETGRFRVEEVSELGNLRFDSSYIDDSGYYNIDIYID